MTRNKDISLGVLNLEKVIGKRGNQFAVYRKNIEIVIMSNSSSTDVDQDALVKSELSKFIMEHTGLDALSSIDEIVLSYIIGVLETLGCANSPEDVFDVDEFAEMMTAYIPDFSNIRRMSMSKKELHF
ncbi:UNVERIFIED_CONTAM: Cuedc2 [Trichonephila clavipes]